MELSFLYKGFKKIIGDGDMPELLRNVLISSEKDVVMSAYVDMVEGDMQTDYLQKIFQYYYADRKDKKQDYTPASIAKLCSAITEINGKIVYDICAGSGALIIKKWAQNPNKTFICEELDERVIPLLLFNMAVRNMTGWVINRNSLTLETVAVYCLVSGERFSNITKEENLPEFAADEIVSNPPYNIKWDAPEPLLADRRFRGRPIPPSSNANFAFVLTALSRMKPSGRCAFILPCGVLSSDYEKEVRKYLIESGMIEQVVVLPGKMFESTDIPTCVIIFSYGNRSIKFYDCRRKATQEQRDQNGQFGGASHENRTYHKMVNALPDDLISAVCGNCQNVPGFSKEILISEISENDYNINPSRYIEFETQETLHRPYADIIADINRIAKERGAIKITCNETIAKQKGIYEVAKLEAENNDSEINKAFALVGGHYENKRYLTLTKNKEFKIENQDKEFLSSLIEIFIPMWKQHILYLNKEESRLLAELRDAMLPELMNGVLKIESSNDVEDER